ncbi:MAG: hypothetical protein L6Q76_26345 [Polyangiaceae bacterium]|nr:hypothetical protein [Polyangiaceae bacterium]
MSSETDAGADTGTDTDADTDTDTDTDADTDTDTGTDTVPSKGRRTVSGAKPPSQIILSIWLSF